jgi:nucleoside-diphosphate-sugar epimerase
MGNDGANNTTTAQPLSLVTGAGSFLGSHLVEALALAGHRVRATDRPETFEVRALGGEPFGTWLNRLGVEVLPADLRLPSALPALVQDVDFLFHAAPLSSPGWPRRTEQAVQVQCTRDLIDTLLAGSRRLRRFVLWGTVGIYGPPRWFDLPLREDQPPCPQGELWRAQWAQEWAVREAGRRHELPFTILRTGLVYGPPAPSGVDSFVATAVQAPLLAAAKNWRDCLPLVHVHDATRAAVALADEPRAESEAYNVCDDGGLALEQVLRLVTAGVGPALVPVPWSFLAVFTPLVAACAHGLGWVRRRRFMRGGAPGGATLSNDKLKRLGFLFHYPDPEAGLTETMAWYRSRGRLQNSPREVTDESGTTQSATQW